MFLLGGSLQMTNLPLSQEDINIFTNFLDTLKLETKQILINRGYTVHVPSFEIVQEAGIEAINSFIEISKTNSDIYDWLSFAMYCSKKLTKNDDINFNIHSMIVDVYRNLNGEFK